ncbi:hypothetical protein HanRHA438_Chr05g0233611 [Helianthus annuus]|nr:hypothetical protein HanRHA438_Chr05g0233611 [Helianthus annuus]
MGATVDTIDMGVTVVTVDTGVKVVTVYTIDLGMKLDTVDTKNMVDMVMSPVTHHFMNHLPRAIHFKKMEEMDFEVDIPEQPQRKRRARPPPDPLENHPYLEFPLESEAALRCEKLRKMHIGEHFAVSWKTLRKLEVEDWVRGFVPLIHRGIVCLSYRLRRPTGRY